MSDERPRRAFWRMALKALGVAALALALLVGVGCLLASSGVRASRFGRRMEQRYPIRWSQIALVFGPEDERLRAVGALQVTGSGRALPALHRAAADRSPRVRAAAIEGIACLVPYAPQGVERRLLALCGSRRLDTRRRALDACRTMLGLGVPPSAALQRTVAAGLQDRDLECRREAAAMVQELVRQHEPLQPEVWEAFAACLRGPSLGPRPVAVRRITSGRYIELPPSLPQVRTALEHGELHARVWALIRLWEMDTAEARRLIEEDLAARPLVVVGDE